MSKKKQDELANKVAPIAESVVQKGVRILAGIVLRRRLPDDFVEEITDFVADKVSEFAGKWISANLKSWKKPADATEACREALIVAVFTAFLNKVTEKEYDLVVDCTAPEDTNAIFGADALEPLKACSFDEHNVKNNELFNGLMDIVEKRMVDAELGEKERHEIAAHIREVIDMLFWRVIEQHAERYKVYTDYFESERKGADAKHYYYKRHEARIAGLYTQEMKLPHVEALALNDIYVEPTFEMHLKCWSKENHETLEANEELRVRRRSNIQEYSSYIYPHHLRKSRQVTEYSEHLHKFLNDWAMGETLLEGCKYHRLLVLLGQPGQGKTSCCKRLIHDVLTNKVIDRAYLINLKNTKIFANIDDPLDYLSKFLRKIFFKDKLASNDDPLKGRKVLLILDGLDEATLNNSATSFNVLNLIININSNLNSDYGGNFDQLKILLTSRDALVNPDQLPSEVGFIIRLNPFSKEQQAEWLNKFNNHYPESRLTLDLIENTHKRSDIGIQEMLEQPVSLFLISISGIDIEKIEGRYDLYDKLFNELIKRGLAYAREDTSAIEHQVAKEIIDDDKDRNAFRKILAQIALACFLDDRCRTDIEEVKKIMCRLEEQEKGGNIFYKLRDRDKNLEKALHMVMIASYLSSSGPASEAAVEFFHRTLMEYLAAEGIINYFERIGSASDDEVLGVLFLLFGFGNISERMGQDLRNNLLQMPEDKKIEISRQLKNKLHHLVVNEFMPKRRVPLNYIIKWCEFEDKKYDIMPWRQASSNVLVTLLALIDVLGLKDYFNTILKESEEIRATWRSQAEAAIRNADFELSFHAKHSLCSLDLSSINISSAWQRQPYADYEALLGWHQNSRTSINLANSNLEGAFIAHIDLSGANLTASNLRGAVATGSKLNKACLQDAILHNTRLDFSNLEYACIMNADLTYANFDEANLSKAVIIGKKFYRTRFRRADLSHAILSNSRLDYANLSEAQLSQAILVYTDLSKAILSKTNMSGAIILLIDKMDLFNEALLLSKQEQYNKMYSAIMDRTMRTRPAHPPATFEEHVEFWREYHEPLYMQNEPQP